MKILPPMSEERRRTSATGWRTSTRSDHAGGSVDVDVVALAGIPNHVLFTRADNEVQQKENAKYL
jgi:hypothetical protein